MEVGIDFIDSRKASVIDPDQTPASRRVSEYEPATFEEAITATKFGKYNVMLAFLALISSWCTVFDTATMSYVFVAAQCDLDLSLNDKGLLNAATYAGMISSAMIWGFLFDVLGRRRLLIFGFFIDAIFIFMSALTQTLPLLIVSKYLQGFIINGPFAAMSSYISEFHCAKYRPMYQMLIGTSNSFGTVLLPFIALYVLPQNMDFTLANLNFHSWNVFLLISALPAFASAILYAFFPESPKFLMTYGQNEKALKIFRAVYSANTGRPPEEYPIKRLVDETKSNGQSDNSKMSTAQALKEGFRQIKPIFFKPHLPRIALTCSILFFGTMGLNMLRLWFPQIFQIMTDYDLTHPGEPAALCAMLDSVSQNATTQRECVVVLNNNVYYNAMVVGTTAMIGNTVAAFIIPFIGKKAILMTASLGASASCFALYFASSSTMAVAFSSLFMAGASVGNNAMISVTVDLFPTTLRTMAIALGMMVGRIGAMGGNFMFPYLLESGCSTLFFVVGGFMGTTALLIILVPNTDMKALT